MLTRCVQPATINDVLSIQDFADIFLPLAKMFNYGKIEPFATIFFAAFAVAWIPTRHGLYFYIYSACYNLDVEVSVYLCLASTLGSRLSSHVL